MEQKSKKKSVDASYELLIKPEGWLSGEAERGVVISSRIRLARNLETFPFPGKANTSQSTEVMQKVKDAAFNCDRLRDVMFLDMSTLDPLEKQILKERRLVSVEFGRKGSGLIVAEKRQVAIMVNEEDHLRIQAMSSGLCLEYLWNIIDDVDNELDQNLDYAFSPKYGYLTACPSNLGTGMRASVMLHLPGLCLMDEIEQVMNGFNRMGFEVRGLSGEGSGSSGNLYQISNRSTLGIPEKGIISALGVVTEEVIEHELNARGRLLSARKWRVRDYVSRALGVLLYAEMLSSQEVVDLLSALKLGLEMGIVRDVGFKELDELCVLTQPGHLQKIKGKHYGPGSRDRIRARLVKEKLKAVSLSARIKR